MNMLRTDRLQLRRFEANDAAALAAYRSDPAVARYQSWDAPFSLAAARSLVADAAAGEPGRPGWFQWAIEQIDAPGIIGDVGINLLEDGRQAMIGYTVAPAFQRRGFASELVGQIVDQLLMTQGLHRVSAECDTRNEASVRLLERVGFRREGHLIASTWSKGEWSDDFVYAILADEWRRGRAHPASSPR